MSPTELINIQCPYCWEENDIVVDCSTGDQDTIEDCAVCCKPIQLIIRFNDSDLPTVEALRDND